MALVGKQIDAGTTVPLSGPVAVQSGNVEDLDALVLVVNTDTGVILDTVVPTITAGSDPTAGTLSFEVTIPDDTTAKRVTIRVDVDDSTPRDVDARQLQWQVIPAVAQRPSP